MKHRFYVSQDNITKQRVMFSENQRNKISRVLRLKNHDEVMVLDGLGNSYRVSADTGDILEKETFSYNRPIKIRVLMGITKLPAFEMALQKAVEIGTDEIVPIITKRSVVKLSDTNKKHTRFCEIAENAFCQCKRKFMPVMAEVINGVEEIPDYNGLKIVFYEDEADKEFKDILEAAGKPQEITLLLGPEGGFTIDEIQLLNKKGFQSGRLTENILRAETAVIFALANINFYFGL